MDNKDDDEQRQRVPQRAPRTRRISSKVAPGEVTSITDRLFPTAAPSAVAEEDEAAGDNASAPVMIPVRKERSMNEAIVPAERVDDVLAADDPKQAAAAAAAELQDADPAPPVPEQASVQPVQDAPDDRDTASAAVPTADDDDAIGNDAGPDGSGAPTEEPSPEVASDAAVGPEQQSDDVEKEKKDGWFAGLFKRGDDADQRRGSDAKATGAAEDANGMGGRPDQQDPGQGKTSMPAQQQQQQQQQPQQQQQQEQERERQEFSSNAVGGSPDVPGNERHPAPESTSPRPEDEQRRGQEAPKKASGQEEPRSNAADTSRDATPSERRPEAMRQQQDSSPTTPPPPRAEQERHGQDQLATKGAPEQEEFSSNAVGDQQRQGVPNGHDAEKKPDGEKQKGGWFSGLFKRGNRDRNEAGDAKTNKDAPSNDREDQHVPKMDTAPAEQPQAQADQQRDDDRSRAIAGADQQPDANQSPREHGREVPTTAPPKEEASPNDVDGMTDPVQPSRSPDADRAPVQEDADDPTTNKPAADPEEFHSNAVGGGQQQPDEAHVPRDEDNEEAARPNDIDGKADPAQPSRSPEPDRVPVQEDDDSPTTNKAAADPEEFHSNAVGGGQQQPDEAPSRGDRADKKDGWFSRMFRRGDRQTAPSKENPSEPAARLPQAASNAIGNDEAADEVAGPPPSSRPDQALAPSDADASNDNAAPQLSSTSPNDDVASTTEATSGADNVPAASNADRNGAPEEGPSPVSPIGQDDAGDTVGNAAVPARGDDNADASGPDDAQERKVPDPASWFKGFRGRDQTRRPDSNDSVADKQVPADDSQQDAAQGTPQEDAAAVASGGRPDRPVAEGRPVDNVGDGNDKGAADERLGGDDGNGARDPWDAQHDVKGAGRPAENAVQQDEPSPAARSRDDGAAKAAPAAESQQDAVQDTPQVGAAAVASGERPDRPVAEGRPVDNAGDGKGQAAADKRLDRDDGNGARDPWGAQPDVKGAGRPAENAVQQDERSPAARGQQQSAAGDNVTSSAAAVPDDAGRPLESARRQAPDERPAPDHGRTERDDEPQRDGWFSNWRNQRGQEPKGTASTGDMAPASASGNPDDSRDRQHEQNNEGTPHNVKGAGRPAETPARQDESSPAARGQQQPAAGDNVTSSAAAVPDEAGRPLESARRQAPDERPAPDQGRTERDDEPQRDGWFSNWRNQRGQEPKATASTRDMAPASASGNPDDSRDRQREQNNEPPVKEQSGRPVERRDEDTPDERRDSSRDGTAGSQDDRPSAEDTTNAWTDWFGSGRNGQPTSTMANDAGQQREASNEQPAADDNGRQWGDWFGKTNEEQPARPDSNTPQSSQAVPDGNAPDRRFDGSRGPTDGDAQRQDAVPSNDSPQGPDRKQRKRDAPVAQDPSSHQDHPAFQNQGDSVPQEHGDGVNVQGAPTDDARNQAQEESNPFSRRPAATLNEGTQQHNTDAGQQVPTAGGPDQHQQRSQTAAPDRVPPATRGQEAGDGDGADDNGRTTRSAARDQEAGDAEATGDGQEPDMSDWTEVRKRQWRRRNRRQRVFRAWGE
ncbi:Uncharacterized protein PBTT_04972 [Plasmodiophora brassicae]